MSAHGFIPVPKRLGVHSPMNSPVAETRSLRAITGLGYQRYRSAPRLSAAALNRRLNLWLIPRYGWRGAGSGIIAGKLPAWIADGRCDAEPQ